MTTRNPTSCRCAWVAPSAIAAPGRQHRLTQLHEFVDGIGLHLDGKAPVEVQPYFEVGLAAQRVMEDVECSAERGQ